MKFKKFLSCFLSIVMCLSMFTAFPIGASAEEFNDTVVQTVFELKAEDILAGNVPAYVNVNRDILDSTNTSAANGVLTKTVSANTNFIQIDLEAAGLALNGTDLDQYSLEIITDVKDSDDATKNGLIMYMNTATVNNLVSFRARETSDFCIVNDNWSAPSWNTSVGDALEAHYTITDLKLSTGEATSHLGQRRNSGGLVNQYTATVAHNTPLSAWSAAPIKGITLTVPNGYRASIDTFKLTRKASFTSEDYVKSEKTVYEMNVEDILAGKTTSGVVISNLDRANSSVASGLISNQTTSSTEFMTITFEDLPQIPYTDANDEMTPIYDVNMEFAFVDSDDTTKNGAWLFFDEVKDPSNMLLRIRETRDGTVYNNGTSTISNGTLGKQEIPTAYYNFKINTETGLFNQHFKKSTTAYIFSNTLSRGDDINLGQSMEKLLLKTPNYTGETYRVVLKKLTITRTAYIENAKYTIGAATENEDYGTVATTGLTDGKAQKGNEVTLTATAKDGYIFKGWYEAGAETAASTEATWTFAAVENVSYVAKFAAAREITQTVFEMDAEAILGGTLPAGVTLNTAILDENASSASALVSDAMASQTAFLTLDLKELSKSLPGVDTGLYTIEVVANQNDSDATTQNGMFMSMTGTAKKDVWRVRESADIAVLNSWDATSSIFSSGTKHNAVASYVFTDLNVNTGAIASHAAKYGTSPVYSGYANGQSVAAGNASAEKPINIIEFRTATTSAGGAMRANIKSIKITRKVLVENVIYTINAVTENEAYGTVAIEGVSEEEATKGQVSGGSEVTLTATAKDGYVFKGWYKEGEDVPASTEKEWTFAASESANYTARFAESYTINKTVFELDAASLEAGTVPSGVTLNTGILDENASSASALISDVVDADTAFLTIDLDKVGIGAGEEGLDIYTIEIVTNVNDSDDNTNNGTLMNLKGTSDVLVFRARESSDICALKNSGWTDGLYWRTETSGTATYRMENLDVTTGAAAAHWLMRGNVVQHADNANGDALGAGNATEETPINTLTVKAASGRRANIVSLKITRQVDIPREYVNVEAVTENDAYGIVSEIGDTAIKYSSITLSAEAKDGYIFDGWYDENTLVSEENPWTFEVREGFSYTARFRKVVDEWVEVYGMDIADILNGSSTNGVVINNLDTVNSSVANGLLSAQSDASTDFMTITFADLPDPDVDQSDVLTDIYRIDMKVNLVDEDDTTKNGILVYYNEAANANMLARARETRDGTFYKNGSATVYGANVGSQKIPSFAYNFKMDTESGLFNQYVKHGVGDYYLFTDTATRGDNITLPEAPEKIIIRNADYNANGVNENYRVNIKSLSVKRLVKVVDTGNAVPVFSKDRVTVVSDSGEIWNGAGEVTTDIEKIIIDLGSEVDASQITSDSVYITCDDEKIESTPEATTGADGVTLVTLTGMTFEAGKSYKIIADGIVNVRGASLQKRDEYVMIKTKASTESGISVASAFIGGEEINAASDITASTEVTVNVSYANIAEEKDVYVIYVAYKGGTMADVKLAKAEDIIGSGTKEATFTTGNVSDVEEINFILWEGWGSMKILDSFGF